MLLAGDNEPNGLIFHFKIKQTIKKAAVKVVSQWKALLRSDFYRAYKIPQFTPKQVLRPSLRIGFVECAISM